MAQKTVTDVGPSKLRHLNIKMSVESTSDEESLEQKSSKEEESSEEELDEENTEEEGVREHGVPAMSKEKDELKNYRNSDGNVHEQTLDTIATKVSDTPMLIAEHCIHMPVDM